jgi:hypothetical protein
MHTITIRGAVFVINASRVFATQVLAAAVRVLPESPPTPPPPPPPPSPQPVGSPGDQVQHLEPTRRIAPRSHLTPSPQLLFMGIVLDVRSAAVFYGQGQG